MHLELIDMLEVAAAVLILGAGIWLYRRKSAEAEADGGGGYGSQGAVILFVIAVIIGMHGLGGMKYRPSASEIEMYQGLKGMTR